MMHWELEALRTDPQAPMVWIDLL